MHMRKRCHYTRVSSECMREHIIKPRHETLARALLTIKEEYSAPPPPLPPLFLERAITLGYINRSSCWRASISVCKLAEFLVSPPYQEGEEEEEEEEEEEGIKAGNSAAAL